MVRRLVRPGNALAGRKLLSLRWTEETKAHPTPHRVRHKKSGKNESLGNCPRQTGHLCQKRGHDAPHDSSPANEAKSLCTPANHGSLSVPFSTDCPGFKSNTIRALEIKFKFVLIGAEAGNALIAQTEPDSTTVPPEFCRTQTRWNFPSTGDSLGFCGTENWLRGQDLNRRSRNAGLSA